MSALRPFDTLLARSRHARDAHHSTRAAGEARNAVSDLAWRELRREIARARRFTRPFTIVRIERRGGGDGWLAYGRAVGSSIRSIDAMWEADDAVYLLLPESDREAGVNLVRRLRREVPDLVPQRAAAVASFPEDGLTSGALLEHLAGDGALDVVERPETIPAEPLAAPTAFDAKVAHAQSG